MVSTCLSLPLLLERWPIVHLSTSRTTHNPSLNGASFLSWSWSLHLVHWNRRGRAPWAAPLRFFPLAYPQGCAVFLSRGQCRHRWHTANAPDDVLFQFPCQCPVQH